MALLLEAWIGLARLFLSVTCFVLLARTPETMCKKCERFGESLKFLNEIGDCPESQAKKWGLSQGGRDLIQETG